MSTPAADPCIGKDGKAYKLTAKQQRFAELVAEGSTQSDAYRQAYDAQAMADKTVWEEACRLSADPKVSTRLNELRAEAVARVCFTVDGLLMALEKARAQAAENGQASAAVQAVMGQAKLLGLITDKVESKSEIKDLREDKPDTSALIQQARKKVANRAA